METKTYNYIKRLYPNEENRKKFIILCSLTYGLQADTLEKVLGIDIDTLKKELCDKNDFYQKPMQFLFFHGTRNQESALARFNDFFKRLVDASIHHNKELIKNILAEIYDKDAKDFREKHFPGRTISDAEIRTLIVYQIKYNMSGITLCSLFNINRKNYSSRVIKYFNDHPEELELKEEHEYISNTYNTAMMDVINNRYNGGR